MWRLWMILLPALMPNTAWAASVDEVAPFHPGIYLSLAAMSLALIVYTSLKVENIGAKAATFLALGAFTYSLLYFSGGASGVLHHVYHIDYPQFIMIPALTVLIASMNLLKLEVGDNFKPGWFMWITVPIIGNFATTWALVPIAVSLFPILKKRHPDSYWTKMILMFIFGANILALGTVLADPPQAYWAVQLGNVGTPMAFFYTGSKFWLFMIMTWVVYGGMLKYIGVEFGEFNREAIIPKFESMFNLGLAVVLCACLAFALLALQGYQITLFLGIVFVCTFIYAMKQGHEVKHNTIHWCVETFTIFIAFFSVVAFMHVLLENVEIADEGMVGAVMVLTWMADNAAAFAAGYPQFVNNEALMLWYNLFPSVTQGSMSPLGNGPQIVAFLVIFVAMKEITAGQVFKEWFKVCWIFAPYLFTWTFEAMDHSGQMGIATQLAIGLKAAAVSFAFMWFAEAAGIVSLRPKETETKAEDGH